MIRPSIMDVPNECWEGVVLFFGYLRQLFLWNAVTDFMDHYVWSLYLSIMICIDLSAKAINSLYFFALDVHHFNIIDGYPK